ncbi:MAG: sulfur carrier protein ThiS [Methanocella sp.]
MNGQKREVDSGISLAELVGGFLAELNLPPEMVTVALNGAIVPRQELPDRTVQGGDVVEYLMFMGGGAQGEEIREVEG